MNRKQNADKYQLVLDVNVIAWSTLFSRLPRDRVLLSSTTTTAALGVPVRLFVAVPLGVPAEDRHRLNDMTIHDPNFSIANLGIAQRRPRDLIKTLCAWYVDQRRSSCEGLMKMKQKREVMRHRRNKSLAANTRGT